MTNEQQEAGAAAAPPEGAGLDIDEYGVVLAHLAHFRGGDSAAVLDRLAVGEVWAGAAAAWTDHLRQAMIAGDLEPSQTVATAFARAKADLAERRPQVDELVALRQPAVVEPVVEPVVELVVEPVVATTPEESTPPVPGPPPMGPPRAFWPTGAGSGATTGPPSSSPWAPSSSPWSPGAGVAGVAPTPEVTGLTPALASGDASLPFDPGAVSAPPPPVTHDADAPGPDAGLTEEVGDLVARVLAQAGPSFLRRGEPPGVEAAAAQVDETAFVDVLEDAPLPFAAGSSAAGPSAVGSSDIGSSAVGSSAVGSSDIGSSDIGSSDIGSSWGASDPHPPARVGPLAQSGHTSMVPAILADRGAALPFPASESGRDGELLERLTREQLASLRAELAVHPERRAAVLVRYGLRDEVTHARLEAAWAHRLAARPDEAADLERLVATYREYLTGRGL